MLFYHKGEIMDNKIEVKRLRKIKRGSFYGYIDIELPSGFMIKDMSVFYKNGEAWFNFPSKGYVDEKTHERKYAPLIAIPDKSRFEKFQKMLRNAFDEFCAKLAKNEPQPKLPF